MRRTLEIFTALIIALPPLAIGAQSQSQSQDVEEDELGDLASDPSSRDFGGAVEDADLEGVEVEGERRVGGRKVAGPGDRHVVETGDTLWDLSERYLGSPWYWPKVWSFNPQIDNPHWIYPGDEIRLGEGQGEGAAEPAQEAVAEAEPTYSDDGDYEEDEVSIAGTIGFRAKGPVRVSSVAFLSEEEVGRAGSIAKSFEEKELLHQGDRIYVDIDAKGAVVPGETAVLFRKERRIAHPSTGEDLGYVIRVLGTARWLRKDSDQRLATAVITRSITEISRGDLVGPAGVNTLRSVERVTNESNVHGIIAGTFEEGIAELAEGHLVFVDKGTSHGLQRGNTMNVIRATDGLDYDGLNARRDSSLPFERIGEILIVDARPGSAVALVLSSVRELRQGDHVAMRAATAAR